MPFQRCYGQNSKGSDKQQTEYFNFLRKIWLNHPVFFQPIFPRFQASRNSNPSRGCCHSKHTRNCCAAAAVFGLLFLVLGVVSLLFLEPLLERKIEESMAITPDSERLAGWLKPPLQGLIPISTELSEPFL